MSLISERKCRKKEPEPTQSSTGRTYMHKNQCQSSYSQPLEVCTSYPLDPTHLTYQDFRQGFLPFVDPDKAAKAARLKAGTGNLLRKHGIQDRGKRREDS